MIPISIGPSDIKEFYDYWNKFKGKKVRIITNSMHMNPYNLETTVILREVVEGIIDTITKLPAGIMLKDVSQFMIRETVNSVGSMGTEERQWLTSKSESDKKEHYENKFIAVTVIETIDFIQ